MALYKDLPLDLRNPDLTDKDAVKQAIRNILHIRKGEMPGKPEFGCPVDNFAFEQLDSVTSTLLTGDLKSALTNYEPRIDVSGVNSEIQEAYNRIDVEVEFQYSGVKTTDYDSVKFSI